MLCEFRLNGKYELRLQGETEEEKFLLRAMAIRAEGAGGIAEMKVGRENEVIVSVPK